MASLCTTNSSAGNVWDPAIADAGLPADLTPHALRHTCVAILISYGWHPERVQQHLRHSSIRVTMDLYGHLYEDDEEALFGPVDAGYRAARERAVRPAWRAVTSSISSRRARFRSNSPDQNRRATGRGGKARSNRPRYSTRDLAKRASRRRPELNRSTGICSPLPNHSATPPQYKSRTQGAGPRADDGIRTRDPHLGKVMLYH